MAILELLARFCLLVAVGPARGLRLLKDVPPSDASNATELCPEEIDWPKNLFHPQGTCKIYLDLPQGNQEAGLGHSFISFNALVAFAARTNVTLRSWFQTHDHGISRPDCRRYFFGNSFWSGPRRLQNCNIESYEYNETDNVSARVKEINDNCATYDNKCFALRLKGALPPDIEGLNTAEYRRVYESQKPERRNRILRRGGRVRIAMHIRRGDVLDYSFGDKQKAEMRLIPNSPYLSLLEKLNTYFQTAPENATLDLTLHCQGATGSVCPDIDGKTYDDFSKALSTDSQIRIGPSSVFEAIDDMCDADVVVTSKSGFSHLVAVLCRKPIFLVVPFWYSYSCISNALPLNVTYAVRTANWLENLTLPSDFDFDKQQFSNLLHQKAIEYPTN